MIEYGNAEDAARIRELTFELEVRDANSAPLLLPVGDKQAEQNRPTSNAAVQRFLDRASSSASVTSGSSITINVPAGTTTNDVMIASRDLILRVADDHGFALLGSRGDLGGGGADRPPLGAGGGLLRVLEWQTETHPGRHPRRRHFVHDESAPPDVNPAWSQFPIDHQR